MANYLYSHLVWCLSSVQKNLICSQLFIRKVSYFTLTTKHDDKIVQFLSKYHDGWPSSTRTQFTLFSPTILYSVFTTGSAVALHCCKAHSKINMKMEISTPCKIVTPENFTLKLGTRDYVEEVTYYTIFDADRPNRWNTTLLWLFFLSCPFFFSLQRPARTARPIFTLYGSNHVVPPKDGPFWG